MGWNKDLLSSIIICLSFVVVIAIGCVITCICRARHGPTQRSPGDSCTRCQLISMGEAYCYSGYCPECGRIPPPYGGFLVERM